MGQKMEIEKKKCLTPEFRVSYEHVFEAHSGFEGQEPTYNLVMLYDKKTDITALKKAAFNAATEKWGDKTKWPKNLRMPFRDGDEKSDQMGYEGTIFVRASSKQRPGVIDRDKSPITKEDGSFYSGCYARATLIAFAYDTAGNRGVSFALQNLQKLRDGEQFSGRKRAEDEFDSVEDEADDSANYGGSSAKSDELEDALGF